MLSPSSPTFQRKISQKEIRGGNVPISKNPVSMDESMFVPLLGLEASKCVTF